MADLKIRLNNTISSLKRHSMLTIVGSNPAQHILHFKITDRTPSCWGPTDTPSRKLKIIHRAMVRAILGVCLRDHVRNVKIPGRTVSSSRTYWNVVAQ